MADTRLLPPGQAVARAADLAVLTRAAYTGSDPLPGLPEPDGARETTSAVLTDLDAGARVWAAFDGGVLVGALRVWEWEIRRVAVHPAAKGTGVARSLLDAVERDALAAGVPEVRLNAVVERCLPSLYAHLGYEAASHWPSPDKPLTELTLRRRPGRRRVARPLPWERTRLIPHRSVRVWMLTGNNLIGLFLPDIHPAAAVRAAATRVAGARLAGVDLCAEKSVGLQRFPADRAAVAAHVLPRAAETESYALWRFPPGREPHLRAMSMEVRA